MLREAEYLHILSVFAFGSEHRDSLDCVEALRESEYLDLQELAKAHHVVIRAFESLPTTDLVLKSKLSDQIDRELQQQRQRVANALEMLHRVCQALEAEQCAVTVIKSLDHHPDLGSDLDLFTNAPLEHVLAVLQRHFCGSLETPSWADRLACKWNVRIPGLPELVEVHANRIGQTGELTRFARRLVERRVAVTLDGKGFMVPAPEDRVILTVLQRMYRHYYIRICDIVNTSRLIASGEIDFDELRRTSKQAGIWPGVATYLRIVSDYVQHYRGRPLPLPGRVHRAARFGMEKLCVHAGFLRVPIFPHGAYLYARQLARSARQKDASATLRLSLLPPLAVAATVGYRVTGSDKGIW